MRLIVINQLQTIHVSQVMHFLKTTRKCGDVFESLPHQFSSHEAQHIFVELADGDFASLARGSARFFWLI